MINWRDSLYYLKCSWISLDDLLVRGVVVLRDTIYIIDMTLDDLLFSLCGELTI